MNPNSNRDFLDQIDIKLDSNFPIFLKSIRLEPFRNIPKLEINFLHPISIITGTNRIGKSTILMAIASSHYDFKKRNPKNGKLERQTWSSLMKFTQYDQQINDWTYWINYKRGDKEENKRGQRKAKTKKWNGIGKKESQFKDRQVVFIDVDRIFPARNLNDTAYKLTKNSTISMISNKQKRISDYLSFVLEENVVIEKMVQYLDRELYRYSAEMQYSSFNSASGEDVLSRIIIDMVEAEKKALILIDEIEIGLHPKIQRRLVDVINDVARTENKQFIITTHSPSILSAFSENSRIFIENKKSRFKAIPKISINAAFTKMDSKIYPLIDLFCEDDIAKKIIDKAIKSIQEDNDLIGFSDLINIVISNAANETYDNYVIHKRTYEQKKIKVGCACVLDGDRKSIIKGNELQYPSEDGLHFLYSDEAPEKFLLRSYLQKHPNKNLTYHVNSSLPHILFPKMVDTSEAIDLDDAFEKCWEVFKETDDGKKYFSDLKRFLIDICTKYSPDL